MRPYHGAKRKEMTMESKKLPETEFLNSVFIYKSGKLYWKINRSSNARKGQEAGSLDSKGYRFIRLNKKAYRTHRIIWKMLKNEDPLGEIDHIDGNSLNNKIKNLRIVSHQENLKNCKLRKDNTSGITGISFNKKRKKWVSYMHINGAMINLGEFDKKKKAIEVRKNFEKLNGFHKNHGRKKNG